MKRPLQRCTGAIVLSVFVGVALDFSILAAGPAGAVEAIWTAPGGGSWFNQESWLGGVPHAPGDTALFDVGAPGEDTAIDIDQLAFLNALTTRNPNRVTLRGRSVLLLDDPTDGGPVHINHATGAGPMIVYVPVGVTNDDLVVRVEDAEGWVLISDFIGNGTIQLSKEGPGKLELGGDLQRDPDLWKGPITVREGTLIARNDNALGSSADNDGEATTVLAGGTLAIQHFTNVAHEKIRLDGGRLVGDDHDVATVGGPVELLRDSTFSNTGAGGWLTLNGPVRGASNVAVALGVIDFHGPLEFSGELRVVGGEAHVDVSAQHGGSLVETGGRLFVLDPVSSLVEAGPTTVRAGGELRVNKPAGTDPAIHSVLPHSVRLDGGQLTLADSDQAPLGFLDPSSPGGAIALANQPNYTAGGTNVIDFTAIGPNIALGAETDSSIAATVVLRPDAVTRELRFGGGHGVLTVKAPITDLDGQPTDVVVGVPGVTAFEPENLVDATLEGENTYTGTTTIRNGGRLIARLPGSLGSAAGPTRIESGGALIVRTDVNAVLLEPITLDGGVFDGAAGHSSVQIGGPIDVVTDSFIGETAEISRLAIRNTISGPGGLTIVGTRITLQGDNTYTGPTVIGTGVTIVESPTALGSAEQGTVVTEGGTLELAALVDEPIEVRGGQIDFDPATAAYAKRVTIADGRVTLARDSIQRTPFYLDQGTARIGGRNTTMAGGTTGEGDLIIDNGVDVVIDGEPLAHQGSLTLRDSLATLNTPNTYTGPTTILRGEATVNHPDALGNSTAAVRIEGNGQLTLNALPAKDFEVVEGNLIVADTEEPFRGTVKLLGRFTAAHGASLRVDGAFDGPVVAEGDNTIRRGTFNGVISGSGRLSLGPVRLAGNNTYEGTIEARGRSIDVDHPNGLGSPELGTRVYGTLNINVPVAEPILVEDQGVVNLDAQIDRFPVRGKQLPLRGDTRISIQTPSTYDERIDLDRLVLEVGADTQLGGLTLRNGSRLIVDTDTQLRIPDQEFVIQSGTLNGTPTGVAVVRKTTMETALIDGIRDYSGELVVEKGSAVIRDSFASAEGRITVDRPRNAAVVLSAGDVIPASVRLNNAAGIGGRGALLIENRPNSSAAVRLTGSLELGPGGSRIGSESQQQSFLRIEGPVSGGALTKMGQELFLTLANGANTFSGTTDVREGDLVVDGEGRIAESSGILIRQGAQLRISNSEAANLGDRIADSIPVDLRGGTLSLEGPVTTQASTVTGHIAEQIGPVTIREGHSTIRSFAGSPPEAQTVRLTLDSLDRAPGATLELEVAPTHRIDAVDPPQLHNGIVGGWATVRNDVTSSTRMTGLATYGENGFVPLDTFVTDIATAGPDDNVLLEGDLVLTADAMINSITDMGDARRLDLGGFQLNVSSGGIVSGRRTFTNGRMTAGNASSPTELFVHGGGLLEADIVDNPAGPVSLVLSRTINVRLAGNNTYSGPTVVNDATVLVLAESALPEDTDLAIHGGTVELHYGATVPRNLGALTIDGGGTLNGQRSNAKLDFDSLELRDGSFKGVVLSGQGPLTKTSDGEFVLDAVLGADYRGPIDIREGRLGITHSDPFGTGEVTVSGGTLFSDSPDPTTISSPLTLDEGEIDIGRITLTGPLTVRGPSRLSIDDDSQITGTIAGTGSLTIDGMAHTVRGGESSLRVDPFTRRLRITENNANFSGAVELASGFVRIEHSSALGTGPLTIGPGARLQLAAPGTQDGAIEMTNAITLDGGQLLAQSVERISGPNRLLGDLTVRSDSFLGVQPDAPLEVTGAVRFGDDVRLTLLDVGEIDFQGPLVIGGNAEMVLREGTVRITGTITSRANAAVLNLIRSGFDTLVVELSESIQLRAGQTLQIQENGVAVPVAISGQQQSISGKGTLGNDLTVGNGGTLQPGASPGRLTVDGSVAWDENGIYRWEIDDATGTAGEAWDVLAVAEQLDVAASPAAPFVVQLVGLDAAGEAGPLANFDPHSGYAWLIASSAEVAGFDPSLVAIDASQFLAHNRVPPAGRFELRVDGGSDLLLVYRVPEPGTLALLASGLFAALCFASHVGVITIRRRHHAAAIDRATRCQEMPSV